MTDTPEITAARAALARNSCARGAGQWDCDRTNDGSICSDCHARRHLRAVLAAHDAVTAERDVLAAKLAKAEAALADAREEGRREVILTNGSTPYPLLDVLRILADAAEHLHAAHNCDSDGWEVTHEAASAAREIIHELTRAPENATGAHALADENEALGARMEADREKAHADRLKRVERDYERLMCEVARALHVDRTRLYMEHGERLKVRS